MRIISQREGNRIDWLKKQSIKYGGNGFMDQPIKDWEFDSLDFVELIMNCEKEFDISIPDDNIFNITNLDDLNKTIKKIINENTVHKTKG